jgi:hypothetical protein
MDGRRKLAQQLAAYELPRTTELCDRQDDAAAVHELEGTGGRCTLTQRHAVRGM